MISHKRLLRLVILGFAISLSACGGGGSGGSTAPATPDVAAPPPPPPSSISGASVNSVIVGAEIKLFRFDESGTEVEIVAKNAPVLTQTDGEYFFEIQNGGIGADAGPLIIRSVGGTMNSATAPGLEAVIADSSSLQADRNTISQSLSPATSIAAELLRLRASSSGAAPTMSDANSAIADVEQGLGFSLQQDPTDPDTELSFFSRSIDNNLGLEASPDSNLAVEDYVEYVALNLSSESGAFDGTMLDPTSGETIEASFVGIGSGLLNGLIPAGPSAMQLVNYEIDKSELENDGLDTALLTVSLTNAAGEPVSDGTLITIETTAGRLTLSKNMPATIDGSATINISSVWKGDAEISVINSVANNGINSFPVALTILDNVEDIQDTNLPRISGAGSTSNTEIIVTFNEAMRGGIESAENPAHYRISAVNSLITKPVNKSGEPEVTKPEVLILDAEMVLPDRKAIRLTTMSQSDLRYEIVVINAVDLQGNSISPAEAFEGPNDRAEFQGIPPSGAQIVDTDGDGLSDSDEQRGWIVTTITAAGQVLTFEVTSDPNNADSDGDGVSDYEEFHGGLNPRTADSDGDTLSDDLEWNTVFSDGLNQDSDGDGVQDGFEYYTFRTSPILADTDGDQISDPDEVAAGNRNPLIADLPSPRIRVGNLDLQLDTRFTFTDETGQEVQEESSFETSLTRGEDETYATSNEKSTKRTLETSQDVKVSGQFSPAKGVGQVSGSVSAGSKQGSERGNTFTVSEASGRSSEESYQNSLTTSSSRDVRESVVRELEAASIRASVSIENLGDIPFTIRNLEVSAQIQDPLDRRRMIPIASLVPQNDFLGFTDDGLAVNIGALGDPERGPFVFASEQVFPQQVQELMKNPRGIILQLANFDIIDEAGNNFAFTSQAVLDRTAGITFDFGDGRVESYRVATASAHNRSNGNPLGITMEYALSIIGLQRYEHIRDGGNGIFESTEASPSDAVDNNLVGDLGSDVEPGRILITAGDDGILQSAIGGDDILVQPDYQTEIQEFFPYIIDGGNGIVETNVVSTDELIPNDDGESGPLRPLEPGGLIATTGPDETLESTPAGDDEIVPGQPARRLLTRYKDVSAVAEQDRFWVMFATQIRPGVDLDELVIRAGEQYDFVYVQDKDDDGVFAREEYLHNSSDNLPNTDSCIDPNAGPRPADNCDNLSDKEEIQDGWRVQLRGSPQAYPVFSNPAQGDSDRDSILDHDERNCLLDPRERDTDGDGLSDWEEITGLLLDNGEEILDASGQPLPYGAMVSRDPVSDEIVNYIEPYAGSDGAALVLHDDQVLLDCSPAIFDALDSAVAASFWSTTGYATNPLNPDTDGDLVSDFLELKLGINPNNPDDGGSVLDDDGDGRANRAERTGYAAVINGVPTGTNGNLTSNPNLRDSDNDLLPDLLEFYLGSNPKSNDTDGDSISDTNEYGLGGTACVGSSGIDPSGGGSACQSIADVATNSYQEYLLDCSFAPACDNALIEGNLISASARNIGSNLNEANSDNDSLSDRDEVFNSYNILVNGENLLLPAPASDPTLTDTDNDGLNDSEEVLRKTDPRNPDTDGDGAQDGTEVEIGTNPVSEDALFEFVFDQYKVGTAADDDTGGGGPIEPAYSIVVRKGNTTLTSQDFNAGCASSGEYDSGDVVLPGPPITIGPITSIINPGPDDATFELLAGQNVTVTMSGTECPGTAETFSDTRSYDLEDLTLGTVNEEVTHSYSGGDPSSTITTYTIRRLGANN